MSSTDAADAEVVPSPGPLGIVRNVARAFVTAPVFMVTHLIRNRHVERTVDRVDSFSQTPPARTAQAQPDDAGTQPAADGVGPLVMRSYSIVIEDPRRSRHELIERLIADPNALNARSIAGFVVGDDPVTELADGDRLVVELPGPWNGPVMVEHADADQLLLATLDGHMEAGRIRFDTLSADDGSDDSHRFVFRITSWARAGDRAFEFLHLRLPIAREMQTAMWVAMCRNAAREAAGRAGRIEVRTEILKDSRPS